MPQNRLWHVRMLTELSLCSCRKVHTTCFIHNTRACVLQDFHLVTPFYLFRRGHPVSCSHEQRKWSPREVTVNCVLGRDVHDGKLEKSGVTQRLQGTSRGPEHCSSSASGAGGLANTLGCALQLVRVRQDTTEVTKQNCQNLLQA